MKNNDRNDESLLDLMKVIWRKKVIVIIGAAVFGLASYIVSLYQENSWTSDAIVTQARFKDIYQVREQLFKYKGLVSNSVFDGLIKNINEEKVFIDFINTYNSYENKKKFILANKLINSNLNRYKENYNLYIENLDFIIKGINSKEENKEFLLSFKSYTSENSLKLLNSYIEFCNEEVNKNIIFSFDKMIDNSIESISNEIKYKEIKAQSKIDSEILKSKIELDIALSAGIKKPLENMNNNELFSISLGSLGIETKIKNLQDNKMVIDIISPNLTYNKTKLATLQRLNKNIKYDNFATYSYIKDASLPIKKNGFNLITKILIGMFFGIAISIFGILIVRALEEK
ncbi:TPA: Wzz/FepE/Etk N-terminal domain-containing protein [Photobacterium damselae]